MGHGGPPTHPLATTALGVALLGLLPLPVVGGIVGAALGAVAHRQILTRPERWSGAPRAATATIAGLVIGGVPVIVVGVLAYDDLGPLPLVAAGAVVSATVLLSGIGGERNLLVALTAPFALAAVAGLLVGVALAVVGLFVLMAGAVLDAIFGRS